MNRDKEAIVAFRVSTEQKKMLQAHCKKEGISEHQFCHHIFSFFFNNLLVNTGKQSDGDIIEN